MTAIAHIWNLSDVVAWTAGGSWAKPRVAWTFSDLDGGTQSAYRVKIYADALKATTLYNGVKTAGSVGLLDVPWAGVLNTTYYAEVTVWDDKDESTMAALLPFKMLWGQAVYEFAPGSALGWQFGSATLPSGSTQKALLFASATGAGGAGRTAWVTSVGDLQPAASDYINVLVRLATDVGGVQPSLSSMSLQYTGSAAVPDHWTGSGGAWAYDFTNYRFGTRSFKCVVGSNVATPNCYPYRFAVGDDVLVAGATWYTFSAYVRGPADRALRAGSEIRLAIYAAGSNSDLLAEGGLLAAPVGATRDTRGFAEGWQRLVLTFQTGAGVGLVRPKVRYVNGGAGIDDYFWVDAWKFEEGRVATAWAPGWLSPAVVLDSYGVMIDASGGANLRIRHSDGVQEAEADAIVEAALGGGGGPSSSNLIWVEPGAITDLVTFG